MYSPRLFRDGDLASILAFVERYPFATLIAPSPDGWPEITHVPCYVDETKTHLWFHVARANAIADLPLGSPVAAVFQGPHAYVSPRWYRAPNEQVPTWNYSVAHVRGRTTGPASPARLAEILDELTRRHEGPEGWRPSWISEELRAGLMSSIVGMGLSIEKWEGKHKLSQNRSLEDQRRVAAAFEQGGTDAGRELAEGMRRNLENRAG
ncbi:MAG: FMN-binding negative transcriptional regulator [Deltaproteobacteria bacterium]|nr:FMN-binding negative transcriptional regulator [Deltaproteobacteria bacterium]